MCHADLAMLSGEWTANSNEYEHVTLRTNAESLCVNWEAVHQWVKDRALPKGQYKIRVGPFG